MNGVAKYYCSGAPKKVELHPTENLSLYTVEGAANKFVAFKSNVSFQAAAEMRSMPANNQGVSSCNPRRCSAGYKCSSTDSAMVFLVTVP